VGFGSFADEDPKPLTDLVLDSLRRTRQRGLLLTGWGGLDQSKLPDNIFAIESLPHDWLFPRVAAVVHHGGAGTTGAVVRAGVPSIAIPWRGDHPFFAESAYDIGAGPPPIPKRWLSAGRLAAAIEAAVLEPRIREGAAAAARRMAKEDGVARAVEIIERTGLRT
jgi:sterol 3beta-glucosyltransferase